MIGIAFIAEEILNLNDTKHSSQEGENSIFRTTAYSNFMRFPRSVVNLMCMEHYINIAQ